MDYRDLEKEIEDRKNKLTKHSWRGNLTTEGLKSLNWGFDLKEIEQESLKRHKK